MNKKELIKLINWCRPVIIKNIRKDNFSIFYKKTIDEFSKLQLNAPKFHQPVNKDNFHFAVFGLSIYKVLKNEFKFKEGKAISILTIIIDEAIKQHCKHLFILRFFMGKMSKSKFVKNMMEKRMLSLNEADGWFIKKAESEAYIAFDIYQCGLLKYLKEQDAPEICCAFCKADYTIAKYMKGLKFVRTKTLANGNNICDFRYFKENKKE